MLLSQLSETSLQLKTKVGDQGRFRVFEQFERLHWLRSQQGYLGKHKRPFRINKVIKALEVAIIRFASATAKTVRTQKFDYVGADLVTLSKLNSHLFLLKAFVDRVNTHDDDSLKPYLWDLGKVYAATIVLDRFANIFLAFN